MTSIPGLGNLPSHWKAERARWLLHRQQRAVRSSDAVVTAFRDGQVTLRSNRRTDGFTEAVQEIGYQGIRKGDLVVHGMDGFAGAIGVSDSDGKSSPVVHAYTPAHGIDARFIAYALRQMATNGLIASMARGIRERSTAFDPATLADILIPTPPLDEQQRVADFLDSEIARLDALTNHYRRLAVIISERKQRLIDSEFEGETKLTPLRYMIRFREGPGIMADDFESEGIPLLRVAGLRRGKVTLTGCNYLDPQKVAEKWSRFRVRLGDRILSGSATMGAVSVVDDPAVVGSIPYTGLIILRPIGDSAKIEYVESFLNSSLFMRQIDILKAGATLQHFGPTHLSQIKAPLPPIRRQNEIAARIAKAIEHERTTKALIARQIELISERRQALTAAAVTGQVDVSAASGHGAREDT